MKELRKLEEIGWRRRERNKNRKGGGSIESKYVGPEEAFEGLCIFKEPNFSSDLYLSKLEELRESTEGGEVFFVN